MRAVAPVVIALVAGGCARLSAQACGCENGAHGAVYGDACACLPLAPVPVDLPPGAAERFLDPDVAPGGDGSAERPWTALDWPAIDALLAQGDVVVFVSATELDGSNPEQLLDRIEVRRTDTGPHRLVLDGRSRFNTSDTAPSWLPGPGARARVPGVLTPFEGVFSRVTVQGFEVTGSRDKGVYWRAGDEVVLRDLVVHDNGGTPAIMLDYSNRSGHRSSDFAIVDNHVYNQVGECIYVGGAEGTGQPSHERVVVARNLVHDCRSPWDTQHDAINVKDGIAWVEVIGNVVYGVDWGIEAGSPGLYANNLVLDTDREGIQINDAFGPVAAMRFVDNVVVRPGHDGVNVVANTGPATGLRFEGTTVVGAGGAGLMVGGSHALDLVVAGLVVLDSAVGVDGWGQGAARIVACRVAGNGAATARALVDAPCEPLEGAVAGDPPGADGLWGTADDGVWFEGGAKPLSWD